MKVVVDENIPFIQGVMEPFIDVDYLPGREITREKIMDADALIIRTRTSCDEKLLDGTPVKFIATATIGFDHIDTEYCAKNNIHWTNAPGCNSGSVQQYLASVLVTLAKKHGFDLKDKTMGVIGVGNVGKKAGKIAEYLGMRIVLNDPPREREEGPCGFVSLDGLLREADVISLHVPLNMTGPDKTHHMVDEAFLKKVNPGTFIINSSRGEVVDQKALEKYLDNNRLSGAVLDVWEGEPEIDTNLMKKLDLATPHIAGYSADGKANGTAMSVQALSKHFDLELYDWYPEDVPEPENTAIRIDAAGKSVQEISTQAILTAYDVLQDDARLRNSPATFEQQRGNYPLRREFPAYVVWLQNGNQKMVDTLKKIGFRVNKIEK
ncbi:MAG: 4-phosphoerythronate dehydrogenase PdxB [Bacteroidota bacterium]